MARRRKAERWAGSASRGIVRRLSDCSSRVRHRGVPDRERVPEQCHASGSAVDVCSNAPAWAPRAERAADGGVVDVARPSLCRHVHRELMRSAWLALSPIIAVTVCHQRNDVERYSRFTVREHTPKLAQMRNATEPTKGYFTGSLERGGHADDDQHSPGERVRAAATLGRRGRRTLRRSQAGTPAR
jgi:hypothetical protein